MNSQFELKNIRIKASRLSNYLQKNENKITLNLREWEILHYQEADIFYVGVSHCSCLKKKISISGSAVQHIQNPVIHLRWIFFFFVKKKKIFSQKARSYTAQKMKFSIRDFFNKCDQMLPVLNV